jgi:CheY-like chemotaxis protein
MGRENREPVMKVLFVDDDAMNRRVVRDMLSVGGVEMTEAADAESGLRLIDERAFDVILMDLRMPGMDGMTAIGEVRNRADAKSTLPVIVVTADSALTLREECLAGGADELLLKPVAMQDLFDAIGRVVSFRSGEATLLI